MWQDNEATVSKKLNILESKIYCQDLILANRKDWRVPFYEELLELVDYDKVNPASIDTIQYIKPTKYWTLSKNIKQPTEFWYVDFQEGITNFESKMVKNKIRCVREISKKAGEY